jgi:adenylate cyclase
VLRPHIYGDMMQETTVNRSVLFADIAGSSKMYELLGDDQARRLIMELLSELSNIVRKYNGESIRTYGDELMCAFGSADDAVMAAANMHQLLDARPPVRWGEIEAIGLYIRVDSGTVIRVGNKLFGDAVNSAAKMKTLAKPFQTLISESTLNYLSEKHKKMTRFVGKLPIKGKSGTYDIFEYLHEEENATLVMERPSENVLSSAALELTCNSAIFVVDENQSTLTIGRLPANDIVLKYPGVSRMHAKVEHRKGKFVLIDASSNGTYVYVHGREPVYVKHDEYQLFEEGVICAGKKAKADSSGAIRFVVRS